ncbi:hypothetical protein Acife_1901 [Acidithiobacillus ferrivorans SS3]|uniref:Lipoprotein n=1 Tax=Acidithiobacillus ferrivorans SS3 TaxID=743299 RepID=G0JL27_9PROT|nr:hypothetical protein [Acidithiobacillus ferrivorans]AEM48024.1 hypothetical protein Acife_1901 [Acidithiobacillus ferrivorans SS3]
MGKMVKAGFAALILIGLAGCGKQVAVVSEHFFAQHPADAQKTLKVCKAMAQAGTKPHPHMGIDCQNAAASLKHK